MVTGRVGQSSARAGKHHASDIARIAHREDRNSLGQSMRTTIFRSRNPVTGKIDAEWTFSLATIGISDMTKVFHVKLN